MKDFIDTVKSGFDSLPEFLSIIIILCFFILLLFGIEPAIDSFIILIGCWAIIFIGLPGIILILDIINRIFGLKNEE